jgi:hypothetical protein
MSYNYTIVVENKAKVESNIQNKRRSVQMIKRKRKQQSIEVRSKGVVIGYWGSSFSIGWFDDLPDRSSYDQFGMVVPYRSGGPLTDNTLVMCC